MKKLDAAQNKLSRLSQPSPNLIVAAVKWIILGVKVQMERRHILTLEDDQLLDVGISHSQAIREGQRPFGDIPDGRLPDASCAKRSKFRYFKTLVRVCRHEYF